MSFPLEISGPIQRGENKSHEVLKYLLYMYMMLNYKSHRPQIKKKYQEKRNNALILYNICDIVDVNYHVAK